jgi:(S)-ureidoglycine aminohydrolase
MRAPHQLVHSRTRSGQRFALMPLSGYPASRLPNWPDAEVRVLASPALGAQFIQYLIDLPAGKRGKFVADTQIETFFFILSGSGEFHDGAGVKRNIKSGDFGLTPPNFATAISARESLKLIVLQKKYEPASGVDLFKGIYGNESDILKNIWADNPHSLLQTLIPDEFAYDLAMNIFTFDSGYGLPVVETHVMEHGLYFLQGKGLYYLGEDWMEVEADDFIWMGPYCPQSFYATGPTPARYLYYKNVNRDIAT